jgi:hypothetical protein
MIHLNFSLFDIFQFSQTILQSQIVYKGVILLLLSGYLILQLIVLNQINAMDKIITQPVSTTILRLLSFILIASGIIMFILIVNLHL